jgi:hypothetical protein
MHRCSVLAIDDFTSLTATMPCPEDGSGTSPSGHFGTHVLTAMTLKGISLLNVAQHSLYLIDVSEEIMFYT